jgi:hypothetical protein
LKQPPDFLSTYCLRAPSPPPIRTDRAVRRRGHPFIISHQGRLSQSPRSSTNRDPSHPGGRHGRRLVPLQQHRVRGQHPLPRERGGAPRGVRGDRPRGLAPRSHRQGHHQATGVRLRRVPRRETALSALRGRELLVGLARRAAATADGDDDDELNRPVGGEAAAHARRCCRRAPGPAPP